MPGDQCIDQRRNGSIVFESLQRVTRAIDDEVVGAFELLHVIVHDRRLRIVDEQIERRGSHFVRRVDQRGIVEPADAGAPALKKAVQVVKAGEPALVDVVTQPR